MRSNPKHSVHLSEWTQPLQVATAERHDRRSHPTRHPADGFACARAETKGHDTHCRHRADHEGGGPDGHEGIGGYRSQCHSPSFAAVDEWTPDLASESARPEV